MSVEARPAGPAWRPRPLDVTAFWIDESWRPCLDGQKRLLEHFPAKWNPVRVKKMLSIYNLRILIAKPVSTFAEYALALSSMGLLSFRAFFRVPDIVPQRLKFLMDRGCSVALDLAIACDQGDAEWGQDRAAAILTAGLPRDRRLPADAVYFIDEIPGALVGHVHGASGGRNRAASLYALEQLDFARSNTAFWVEINPQAQ